MITWCIILITLGIFGILQDLGFITFGSPYRLSTWIVMLIALGILVRVRFKEKTAEKEKMMALIKELQKKLRELQQ